MITPLNSQPYLITSRFFPPDLTLLQPELNKAWIETAQAVNARVIGSFEPIENVTGEKWFEESDEGQPVKRRQTYRKFFRFGAIAMGATLPITHGISTLDEFTRIYGTCETDVTDFRPIPYASASVITLQIELQVTATVINIINGATAPAIVRGVIVLEYLKL